MNRDIEAAKAETLTPEHAELIQEKVEVLEKARQLQTELAQVRLELTSIDRKLIKSGFNVPNLACW